MYMTHGLKRLKTISCAQLVGMSSMKSEPLLLTDPRVSTAIYIYVYLDKYQVYFNQEYFNSCCSFLKIMLIIVL